jgi:hypothetical protein
VRYGAIGPKTTITELVGYNVGYNNASFMVIDDEAGYAAALFLGDGSGIS